MDDQKEKDAIRLLNKEFPIWKFLGKEFWGEVLNSPIVYVSFLIVLFSGVLLISQIIGMGEDGVFTLSPKFFALAALLIGTACVGVSSTFNILRVQQLRKHLELIQRAQENKQ